MQNVTRAQIQKLARHTDSPSVSIFMKIVADNGPSQNQNKAVFRELTKEAQHQLLEWQDVGMVRKTFKPAQELLRDESFWSQERGSLGVFLSEGEIYIYKFYEDIANLAMVSDRFHIRPLLNVFVHNGEYYVLALSRASARLLAANQQEITEVKLKNLPRDLKNLFKSQDRERVPARAASAGASFHAMVPSTQWQETALEDYCRLVDKSIRQALQGRISPLILAGLPTIQAMFKKVTHYPNLAEVSITTNPDRLSSSRLHHRSWHLVAPHFHREDNAATEKFAHFSAREPARVTNNIEEIVRSAHTGRVDTLLIKPGHHVWGVYDESLDDIMVHNGVQPGNYDLLDMAATQTFQNGGKVLPFTGLDGARLPKAAAILRY